ncbi:hypothetical protein OGAPHI_002080 [Ogataea philodendri]|uniref:DUF3835 domain-containing protein n=2 Tax=Ogataea TaxID=461281 RepID=A0A9P8T6Z3_9ASCO|nr:uncharacterized protein OGAPHI_002080 [Ogataea philodendri]KAH3668326.1 hypothetical protein OGAPHI_002080 [Ogataea philodendri]
MDKEISLIDDILYNLVAVKQLYEFEVGHLSTFLKLNRQFVVEKSSDLQGSCSVFKDRAAQEERWVVEKLRDLNGSVEKLAKEIEERKASKKKLMELFESLRKVDEFEQASGEPVGGLPIMEIREDLDEDGRVVSSGMQPYQGGQQAERQVEEPSQARIEDVTEEEENKEQLAELLEDMELGSARVEEEPQVSDSNSAAGPAIDPEDLLTLEMIAEDFDEEEDPEDDYDDDEDYDEEEYVTVVPDGARNRFLEQISQLRQAKQKPSAKKSVKFDEAVQVKEIENVSEELKKSETVRVSRFKQQRRQGRAEPEPVEPQDESDDVMGDVVEKEPEIKETSLDYRTLQNDIDTMARAYALGMYDDDIETHGEVIEKLEDFERHNQIAETRAPVEEPVEEETAEDSVVLVDKVVENDVEPAAQEPEFELADDVLESNVAMDYTRLRNKMMHQYNGGFLESDKEKEFEPIEPVKTSRFKAARLARNI